MSIGKTNISNLLESKDVLSTIKVLRYLGIKIKKNKKKWEVRGHGTSGYLEPKKLLNCGNSGTTARLMIGAVASNPISCTFVGDDSLSNRSMSRVTNYLEKIGTEIQLTKKDYLPLYIKGNDNLLPKIHKMKKSSAQVKSAIMLAGLNIRGKTKIIENKPTRDHTEKLLKYLNVKFNLKKLKNGGSEITLNGPYEIKPKNLFVSGDPSSAAFFIVGALIIPDSKITLKDVMLNPTRIAFVNILRKMGGKIKIGKRRKRCGEEIGNIEVRYSKLKGITINSSLSPLLIDEYPILSIAATQASGKTIMKGLSELRHKESDRINSIVYNLKKLKFNIKSEGNNIIITGKKKSLTNKALIKTFDDHRIAMSFSILNVIYSGALKIDNPKCISISYPDFNMHLKKLLK